MFSKINNNTNKNNLKKTHKVQETDYPLQIHPLKKLWK